MQAVPRIGELLVSMYRIGNEPLQRHYFRVRDVMHNLENKSDGQLGCFSG